VAKLEIEHNNGRVVYKFEESQLTPHKSKVFHNITFDHNIRTGDHE